MSHATATLPGWMCNAMWYLASVEHHQLPTYIIVCFGYSAANKCIHILSISGSIVKLTAQLALVSLFALAEQPPHSPHKYWTSRRRFESAVFSISKTNIFRFRWRNGVGAVWRTTDNISHMTLCNVSNGKVKFMIARRSVRFHLGEKRAVDHRARRRRYF